MQLLKIQKINVFVLLLMLITGFFLYFVHNNYIKNKYGIFLNLTTSLNDSFFVVKYGIPKDIKKGDVIVFKFNVEKSIYYPKGTTFGKLVACNENDNLTIKQNSYFCNKRLFTTASNIDSNGKKIDKFNFNGVIPKNKFFMIGTAYNSYDSRYWGFIDKKDIIGYALW